LTTYRVKSGSMKTSIDLDDELAAAVKETVSVTREKPATVLRMAIRAGLPVVRNRLQAPRPEGYLAPAYRNYPKERLELEAAFGKVTTGPDR
jgi:Arc/MetJ family transcription regulator